MTSYIGSEPYSVKLYEPDGYPESSVLHGQTRIQFLDSYESERDAVEAHPELLNNDEISYGSAFLDEDLKRVDHIPDEPDYLY